MPSISRRPRPKSARPTRRRSRRSRALWRRGGGGYPKSDAAACRPPMRMPDARNDTASRARLPAIHAGAARTGLADPVHRHHALQADDGNGGRALRGHDGRARRLFHDLRPPQQAPRADVLAVAFEPYAEQCPYLFKPGGLRYSRSSFVDGRHTTVMEDYRWG